MIPIFLDPNAPVAIGGSGPSAQTGANPIKNAIVYNSAPAITLNNPADAGNDTYDVEQIQVSPAFDETVEPNADRDGSISGEPREVQKLIVISGWVRGPTFAKLNDKIAALQRAFNPVLAWLDGAEPNRGYFALDFAQPTTNTADWSDGYILQRYYARPIRTTVSTTTKFDDMQAKFTITLRAVDGRRYQQTTTSANRTGSGDVTADNSKSTYPSWPVITLAFTTNLPVSDIIINRSSSGGSSVALFQANLQDATNKTLEIDYQYRTAKYVGGADKTSALNPYSQFQTMLPDVSNTWTFQNLPSGCVATVTWRRAFA